MTKVQFDFVIDFSLSSRGSYGLHQYFWKSLFTVDGTTAQYPLMFRISNGHQSSYCSVREFSAPSGNCYIPRWVFVHPLVLFCR